VGGQGYVHRGGHPRVPCDSAALSLSHVIELSERRLELMHVRAASTAMLGLGIVALRSGAARAAAAYAAATTLARPRRLPRPGRLQAAVSPTAPAHAPTTSGLHHDLGSHGGRRR